jgi:hypothetical protein
MPMIAKHLPAVLGMGNSAEHQILVILPRTVNLSAFCRRLRRLNSLRQVGIIIED